MRNPKLSKIDLQQRYIAQCYLKPDINSKVVRQFSVVFPIGFMAAAAPGSVSEKDLLNEVSSKGTVNYFSRNAKKEEKMSLPDDLDDTVLLWRALYRLKGTIDSSWIANIISLEQSPGGPYRSWYVEEDSERNWKDVDLFVNANLVALMREMGIQLRGAEEFIRNNLKMGEVESPYYIGSDMLCYYLAEANRFGADFRVEKLIGQIRSELIRDIVLLKLREKVSPKKSYAQIFFCKDYAYHGAPTFTTNSFFNKALLLELSTLSKHNTARFKTKGEKSDNSHKKNEKAQLQQLEKQLLELVSADFSARILQEFPLAEAKKTLELAQKLNKIYGLLSTEELKKLQMCLYLGWAGYSLLDDVLDSQSEVSEILKANIALRAHYKLAREILAHSPKMLAALESLWDQVDQIYLLEQQTEPKTKSRLSNLLVSTRMSAYIFLVSLLVDSKQRKQFIKILEKIVLLDQLNDDAHDWYEDYTARRVTAVTYSLYCEEEFTNLAETKKKIYFWEKYFQDTLARSYWLKHSIDAQIEDSRLACSQLLVLMAERSFAPFLQAEVEREDIEKLANLFR
ncbi:MAG: hypothetical protein ACOCXP_02595 [Candidatus Dojkabacteria bacterium]